MNSIIRKPRLIGIVSGMAVIAMIVLMLSLLPGCSSTQCANGQRALTTAMIGYDAALASGNAKKIKQYRWTMDAAKAMMDIWCMGQGEELEVTK